MIALAVAVVITAANLVLVLIISARHEAELARREDADLPLQARADAIAWASQVALNNAKEAWREGDQEKRRFWMGVQEACSTEVQDVAAGMHAGVP